MKQKTVFLCNECGYESPKWYGKCPSCGAWNSMDEFKETKAAAAPRGVLPKTERKRNQPLEIGKIETNEETRFRTGISELDRVLGGGAVHGSFVLVGGEPGIGKSTLLLQMCQEMSRQAKILYVSGEESLRQIRLRADRLHISSPELFVLAETDLEEILAETELLLPDVLIVDSIQTIYKSDLNSAPGNTTQIKECAMTLMQYAKRHNVTIFIVGHVNKEGTLAGPKILEHMVDCVLYFEGEKQVSFRCLRAAKNRFGSTNEIGVFEMSDCGLVEVPNPSAAMLSGHPTDASGNCIACTMEGSRPILAEIQALVTKTAYGTPRRMSAGVDYNRMVLLLAILEKRVGLYLSSSDAYINVIGGMRLDEPAIDLPIALAVASSYRDQPLPEGVMSFGEVGLTGELRAVTAVSQRIHEAIRLGFTTCIMPKQDIGRMEIPKTFRIVQTENIAQAIGAAFGRK
ncbi:DNA repair protein RadA [Butyricicoccus sp.]|uniref:DNA repair protein RadA n=1 Tax=Butyricicoccus sp. TaxID=2049021 RepID=UPI003AAE5479